MGTERKHELIQAILELEVLLANKENYEKEYQKFFESNQIVLKILGYLNATPFTKESNKRLPKDEFTGLQPEPDFIAQNKQGLYEIVELKTPFDKKLLIDSNKYRERFTAEVISYIEQTITYEKYFSRNPANRKKVHELFGMDIQEDLPINIIIGMNDDIDRKKIHAKINQYSYRIDIITFDEILNELKSEYSRIYARYEGQLGFSVQIVFRLHEEQENREGYIFDSGSRKKNRFSLYCDYHKDICFEVIPNNGKSHIIKIDSNEHNAFKKLVFVHCEFAKIDTGFYMGISINGKEQEETIKKASVRFKTFKESLILGAEIHGSTGANMILGYTNIDIKTLDYHTKYAVLRHIHEQYPEIDI